MILSISSVQIIQGVKYPISNQRIYGKQLYQQYKQIWKNLEYLGNLENTQQAYNNLEKEYEDLYSAQTIYDISSYIPKSSQKTSSNKQQLQNIKQQLDFLSNIITDQYQYEKLPIGTIIPIIYDSENIDFYKTIQNKYSQYGIKIAILNENEQYLKQYPVTDYIQDNTQYIVYSKEEIAAVDPTTGDVAVTLYPSLYKILRQDTRDDQHNKQQFYTISYQQFNFNELFKHFDTEGNKDNREFITRYIPSNYSQQEVSQLQYRRFRDSKTTHDDIMIQQNNSLLIDDQINILHQLLINYDIQENKYQYYNTLTKQSLDYLPLKIEPHYFYGPTQKENIYYLKPDYKFYYRKLRTPKKSNLRNDGKCFIKQLSKYSNTIESDSQIFTEYSNIFSPLLQTMNDIQQKISENSEYPEQLAKDQNPNYYSLEENKLLIQFDQKDYTLQQFSYNYPLQLQSLQFYPTTLLYNKYNFQKNNTPLQHYIDYNYYNFKSINVSSQYYDILDYISSVNNVTNIYSFSNMSLIESISENKLDFIQPVLDYIQQEFSYNKFSEYKDPQQILPINLSNVSKKEYNYDKEIKFSDNDYYTINIDEQSNKVLLSTVQSHTSTVYIMIIGYL